MAIGAGKINVASGQGKGRLPVVVKVPGTPVTRAVTGFAPLAQRLRMRIVLFMTGITAFLDIVKRRRRMTLIASQLGMTSDQGKACKVVLEANAGGPCQLAVTITAADSELTCMGIIFAMTTPAVARQRILYIGQVAGIALQ